MIMSADILSMARGLRDVAGLEKKAPLAIKMTAVSKICFIRVWLTEMANNFFLCGFQSFRAKLELTAGEIKIVGAVDRYQMQMSMRHLQSHDGKTTSIAGK